ncbi:hypothetical protein LSH36_832g00039 [Paralvinella palmiformis]|uniref:Uncharacterized protein n=1 Tax=Paralvinella palmiformis TaxID=53620 RepID=A0AAD9MTR8_9ANNE|nr:hypothetical protein LSH36_832g00039 [Paralvinella palmiformis]
MCDPEQFTEWPGIHASGLVIQIITQRVTVGSCERVCRLYTNCVGFSVNWTDIDANIGSCVMIGEKSNWAEPEVFRKNQSFFGKQLKIVL